MRDKKKRQPECSQCGRKRGVLKDPCSKPCEEFKANHEELTRRVEEADTYARELRVAQRNEEKMQRGY